MRVKQQDRLVEAFFALLAIATPLVGQDGQNSNTCGGVDPGRIRLAEAVGAVPLFQQPSDLPLSENLMRAFGTTSADALFYATDHLAGKPRTYTLPVNSFVDSIKFVLAYDAQGTRLKVKRPSGQEVASGDGVEVSEWTCGRVISIATPEKGQWQVELSGTGQFWLRVDIDSRIFILESEFVRHSRQVGEEGGLRIVGEPAVGSPGTLRVLLSGRVSSVACNLVSTSGRFIQAVNLEEVNADGDYHEYAGNATLSSETFRVVVKGQDPYGVPFERYFLAPFRAGTIEIEQLSRPQDIAPGSTTTLAFKVTNLGANDTFAVMAIDNFLKALEPQPNVLTIQQGASMSFRLPVRISSEAPIGTRIQITIGIGSPSNPNARGGITVEFTLSGPLKEGQG